MKLLTASIALGSAIALAFVAPTSAFGIASVGFRHPSAHSPLLRMSAVEETTASDGGAPTGDDDEKKSGGDVDNKSADATVRADGSSININAGQRQKMYGDTLEFPDTYIMCGRCKTAFAIQADDLGNRGKGRRVECSVCSHSWYQARDRLFTVNENYNLLEAPQYHLDRISSNIEAGREPAYAGDYKFYVGNLNFGATEEDLREAFSTKGEVGDVNIITDDEGQSRGFAFVTMMTKEGGDKAIELDGEEVAGRRIAVRPPNN